jgi:hypothetical protein
MTLRSEAGKQGSVQSMVGAPPVAAVNDAPNHSRLRGGGSDDNDDDDDDEDDGGGGGVGGSGPGGGGAAASAASSTECGESFSLRTVDDVLCAPPPSPSSPRSTPLSLLPSSPSPSPPSLRPSRTSFAMIPVVLVLVLYLMRWKRFDFMGSSKNSVCLFVEKVVEM